MITKEQSEKLIELANDLVKAEIANSWKGASDPADHAAIEVDLEVARIDFLRFVVSLTEKERE